MSAAVWRLRTERPKVTREVGGHAAGRALVAGRSPRSSSGDDSAGTWRGTCCSSTPGVSFADDSLWSAKFTVFTLD